MITNKLAAYPWLLRLTYRLGRHHNAYPLEGLLRPPVEWYSTLVLSMAAVLCLTFAHQLMLTQIMLVVCVTVLLLLAAKRFLQGLRALLYQHHLKTLPYYQLSSQQLVRMHQRRMPERQFIGRGFKWTSLHTQRLKELSDPDHTKYLATETDRVEGGNPALHGIEIDEEDVFINQGERVAHTLYLGTTRVGKTRALETNIIQDIERGDCVIVIDPKGDQDLLRRVLFEAERIGREKDVIAFHLGFPDVSARYNPIGDFERITEVANRIANQLPGSGDSQAFREFAWRFTNIITKALVALGRTPTYLEIQHHIGRVDDLLWDYADLVLSRKNAEWETVVETIADNLSEKEIPRNLSGKPRKHIALVRFIEENRFSDDVIEGLMSSFNYDKTYYDKITASLLPLLEKLTSGRTVELISPTQGNDHRPSFNWNMVIEQKKIVYVGLDALSDKTVAEAVGNSMFADLVSVAGKRYKEGNIDNRVCLHADEFNELIGNEFIPLLNKAGGAKFCVTAYTQTWTDVAAKLNSREKAGQIAGNLNTIICLRVLEKSTAEMIIERLPKVPVVSSTQVSTVTDTGEFASKDSDFRSSNEDRLTTQEVPLLTADCLMQLPKGQAFALVNGGQIYKVRLPLPADDMSRLPGGKNINQLPLSERYSVGEALLRRANRLQTMGGKV